VRIWRLLRNTRSVGIKCTSSKASRGRSSCGARALSVPKKAGRRRLYETKCREWLCRPRPNFGWAAFWLASEIDRLDSFGMRGVSWGILGAPEWRARRTQKLRRPRLIRTCLRFSIPNAHADVARQSLLLGRGRIYSPKVIAVQNIEPHQKLSEFTFLEPGDARERSHLVRRFFDPNFLSNFP
jgi:hypothetical protein